MDLGPQFNTDILTDRHPSSKYANPFQSSAPSHKITVYVNILFHLNSSSSLTVILLAVSLWQAYLGKYAMMLLAH